MALQILFQSQFSPDLNIEELAQTFAKNFSLQNDMTNFCIDLVKGVLEKKEEIDIKINKVSTNWKTTRMSLVDLSIMRLALYEALYYHDTDSAAVAFDEALELTKKYSTDDAVKFINGIIDKIWKEEKA